MTKLCPRCGSLRVVHTNYGQRVGGTVGTVAGAVSGAVTSGPTGALIGSRIGMQVGVIAGPAGVGAGAVLGAIAGAFAGCLAGLRLGKVVDQHLFCHHRCTDCRAHFCRFISPNPFTYSLPWPLHGWGGLCRLEKTMAHEIEKMAYVATPPWHGLGSQLSRHQPLEVWQHEAGMNWHIEESPVRFVANSGSHLGSVHAYPEQKVLYRSDTKAPLSVVSQRYKVVQPWDVLEFYRDLTEYAGFELETAGVLKGGRKFWALARTGQASVLRGNDQVNGYLLLATSCDGTLATVATPTTVRVVCNNTLAIAVNGAPQSIRVPHSTEFNPQAVKLQLGISVSQWDDFMYRMKTLSQRKISYSDALKYFLKVICDAEEDVDDRRQLNQHRALEKVQDLYHGKGRGSQLESAQDTAWGLLCAVTEYVDHEKQARSNDNRLDSAWFGQGATLKQKALDHALTLVA